MEKQKDYSKLILVTKGVPGASGYILLKYNNMSLDEFDKDENKRP